MGRADPRQVATLGEPVEARTLEALKVAAREDWRRAEESAGRWRAHLDGERTANGNARREEPSHESAAGVLLAARVRMLSRAWAAAEFDFVMARAQRVVAEDLERSGDMSAPPLEELGVLREAMGEAFCTCTPVRASSGEFVGVLDANCPVHR